MAVSGSRVNPAHPNWLMLHLFPMIYRYLFLCTLPLLGFSCLDQLASPASPSGNQQIQISSEYPDYWSWDGKDPVLLLGAGGATDAFLDPEQEQKLNILDNNGGNYVSIMFNLDIHKSKEDSLLAFLQTAEDKGIVVDLHIWGSPTKNNSQSNSIGKQARELLYSTRRFKNLIYSLDIQDRKATEIALKGLPAEAITNHQSFEPPLNKQQKGAEHWSQLSELFADKESPLPYQFTGVRIFGQDEAEGIGAFNRCVLAGAAVVRHQARPQGAGFSGPALASIRAIRTIEHHFNIWDLKPAPHITPTADPNEAYPMTDGNNGYLIYLPTAGSVFLQLDIKEQIPLKVSVVGYLGTQKSEILNPPYDTGFTLYTEEPRGGWMIIKPVR